MKVLKLEQSSFWFHGRLAKQYLALGVTSFLLIQKYGALDPLFGREEYAQIPMAVVGIVMKFFQIVISIAVGTAAGCIPLVGYNVGAERRDRVRSLFTRLLLTEALGGGGCPADCGAFFSAAD